MTSFFVEIFEISSKWRFMFMFRCMGFNATFNNISVI